MRGHDANEKLHCEVSVSRKCSKVFIPNPYSTDRERKKSCAVIHVGYGS